MTIHVILTNTSQFQERVYFNLEALYTMIDNCTKNKNKKYTYYRT